MPLFRIQKEMACIYGKQLNRDRKQGKKMRYLVIDVGGTAIKYAIMDRSAQILERGEVETPTEDQKVFIEVIGRISDRYENQIEGIAMCLPGMLDSETGYLYTGGALSYNYDCNIVALLEERCKIKVTIENDAKCAALAELWKGSMQGCKDGIVVVLGTGIGGALIVDGKLHKGKHFSAGEFSFICTDMSRPSDTSQMWASKSGVGALVEITSKKTKISEKELNGRVIFDMVNKGDSRVLEALEAYTDTIAPQLFNLQMIFDPEQMSIGGGISAQDILFEYLQKSLNKIYDNCIVKVPQVKLAKCTFCNDSNMIGALYRFCG